MKKILLFLISFLLVTNVFAIPVENTIQDEVQPSVVAPDETSTILGEESEQSDSSDTVTITKYENDFSSNCIDFSPAMRVIGVIILILKISIPIIIIVMSSINIYTTITSDKPNDYSSVAKKAGMSILGGVLIFLSSNIIDVVFLTVTNIIGVEKENLDINYCRECIFHPLSEECERNIELSDNRKYGEIIELITSSTTTTNEEQSSKTTSTKNSGGGGGGGGNKNVKYSPYKNRLLPNRPFSSGDYGLWIAHQKNTKAAIQDALSKGFYGIEVDVSDMNGQLILHHSGVPDDGTTLEDFLKIAKENNILAVLDLKVINKKYSEIVSLVKKHYSMDSVVFMAMEKDKLEGIYNVDNTARLWYCRGTAETGAYSRFERENVTDDFASKLEGISTLAKLIDKDLVDWAHEKGLTVEIFSYIDILYSDYSTSTLREWGVEYFSANEIDEK